MAIKHHEQQSHVELASPDDCRREVREQLLDRWGQSRPLYQRSLRMRRRQPLHNPGKFISVRPFTLLPLIVRALETRAHRITTQ